MKDSVVCLWNRDALYYAAIKGDIDAMQKILDDNPNRVNDISDLHEVTPIFCAFLMYNVQKRSECITFLKNRGANLFAENVHGHTLYHYAARQCETDLLSFCYENKLDINKQDNFLNTPLHNACLQGSYHITEAEREKSIRFLLEYGADVRIKNIYGRTPAQEAVAQRLLWAANLLLEYEAFNLPPHECSDMYHFVCPQLSDIRTATGRSVLHNLAIKGLNLVDARVILKEDPFAVHRRCDTINATPLLLVAANNSTSAFARLLIEHGADLKATCQKGKTVLHYAANSCSTALLETFMSYPNAPSLDVRCGEGYTVLMAVGMGAEPNNSVIKQLDMAKYLIEFVQIDAKDNKGRTAEDIARANGHDALADFLKAELERRNALKTVPEVIRFGTPVTEVENAYDSVDNQVVMAAHVDSEVSHFHDDETPDLVIVAVEENKADADEQNALQTTSEVIRFGTPVTEVAKPFDGVDNQADVADTKDNLSQDYELRVSPKPAL